MESTLKNAGVSQARIDRMRSRNMIEHTDIQFGDTIVVAHAPAVVTHVSTYYDYRRVTIRRLNERHTTGTFYLGSPVELIARDEAAA